MEDPVRHAAPTTDLGAESEPGNGGEYSEVADWQGTRRGGGSLFHRWGAAYRKERLVILTLVSHAEYVPTLTAAAALRVKAALSKAAWWPWSLIFWPWKWCPIVTCDVGYPCANFGLLNPLYSRLRPDVRDRQTSDRRQTSDKSIA